MSEFNPHHPVTEALHDQWHKIAAILLDKLLAVTGKKELVITTSDLFELDRRGKQRGGVNMVAHDKHDGLHLFLASDADAKVLVQKGKQ